jgi:hypothetical protein
MSADFSTINSQITFASLGITQNTTLAGPQGVAYDGSDNTLWFASPETNLIYHMSKAGALLGTLSFTGANGLTYDPGANQLVCCQGIDNPTLTWLNKSTGATVRTIPTTVLFADHLFIDPDDTSAIYVTGGTDDKINSLYKYNSTSGQAIANYSMLSNYAIEGVYVHQGSVWCNADMYYHQVTNAAQLNKVLTYTISDQSGYPVIASRFQIFGTAHIPASIASTHGLISLGTPVNSTGTAGTPQRPGGGLFFAGGSTAILRYSTNNTAFDFSVTTSTAFLFFLDVDTAAQTATLYVNGVLVASTNIASATPAVFGNVPIAIGCCIANGTLERFTNADIGNIGVANNAQSLRQVIEGWCAWNAEQQSLLPTTHPFHNFPPRI